MFNIDTIFFSYGNRFHSYHMFLLNFLFVISIQREGLLHRGDFPLRIVPPCVSYKQIFLKSVSIYRTKTTATLLEKLEDKNSLAQYQKSIFNGFCDLLRTLFPGWLETKQIEARKIPLFKLIVVIVFKTFDYNTYLENQKSN